MPPPPAVIFESRAIRGVGDGMQAGLFLIDPDGGIRLVWTIPPHELMEHYPRR